MLHVKQPSAFAPLGRTQFIVQHQDGEFGHFAGKASLPHAHTPLTYVRMHSSSGMCWFSLSVPSQHERAILSALWACQGVQHAQLVVYALRVFYLQNTGDSELGVFVLRGFSTCRTPVTVSLAC